MTSEEELDFSIEELDIKDLDLFPELTEVKDPNITQLFSNLFAGTTVTGNSKNFYHMTLQPGETLANVKGKNGVYRGFIQGGDGRIKRQGEFTKPIHPAQMMQLASFAVGLYYMNNISESLQGITENIQQIEVFQEEELKSRIKSVVVSIKKKTQFIKEIIESEEVRRENYNALLKNEDDVTQILSQVNGLISNITEQNKMKFSDFQKDLQKLVNLQKYKEMLLTILNEVGQLALYLSMNTISLDQAYYTYNLYFEESSKVNILSKEWVLRHEDYFQYDDENRTIVENKTIGKFANMITDKMNDGKENQFNQFIGKTAKNIQYKEVSKGTTQLINEIAQIEANPSKLPLENPYNRKVQYIKKDDKLFYIVA